MINNLNVTIVQSELHWHDPAKNRAMFSRTIDNLTQSTDLIVLPEMFSTGFSMETTRLAEPMSGPTVAWMYRMAQQYQVVLMGSLMIEEAGHYYNRLIWMPPDGNCNYYDKRHLFRMAGEDTYFTPGSTRLTVELNGWRICPLICYDLRFPVFSRNNDAYDLLIYVANWPAKRRHAWHTLLKARAIENLSYVIGVNRIGVDGNGVSYTGDSAALTYVGEDIVCRAIQPFTKKVSFDYAALEQHRANFPAHLDADSFTWG